MTLILPKSYQKDKDQFATESAIQFKKELESFIDENSSIREPYFILHKAAFNAFKANQLKKCNSVYLDQRPPFIRGSMVFFVDNVNGICERLWTVNQRGGIKFNLDAPKKLKDKLRVAHG